MWVQIGNIDFLLKTKKAVIWFSMSNEKYHSNFTSITKFYSQRISRRKPKWTIKKRILRMTRYTILIEKINIHPKPYFKQLLLNNHKQKIAYSANRQNLKYVASSTELYCPSKKAVALGMTLKCPWWWCLHTGHLECVKYHVVSIIPRSDQEYMQASYPWVKSIYLKSIII